MDKAPTATLSEGRAQRPEAREASSAIPNDPVDQAVAQVESQRNVEVVRQEIAIQLDDGRLTGAVIMWPSDLDYETLVAMGEALMNLGRQYIVEQARRKPGLVLVKGPLPPVPGA